MPRFSVDIQHTEEFTYLVDADTEEEAEEAALCLYRNGDEANHEEIVGAAEVTNCEEIR
ncbi:MAG: hypothetical protein WC869_00040 [Phycisphaerae bacterium]|jgi:hypothetical protein